MALVLILFCIFYLFCLQINKKYKKLDVLHIHTTYMNFANSVSYFTRQIMWNLCKLVGFLFLLLYSNLAICQQTDEDDANTPKFKMTKWSQPNECQGKGTKFETGYVSVQHNDEVIITIYFQKTDNTWIKKTFQRNGTGYIQINLVECDFTGNHYGYVCLVKDEKCKFPTEQEVSEMHNKSSQIPRFKVTKRSKKDDCNGVNFEEGYVYSPSGKPVEVSIYMEKKDGTWRKKHYIFNGTGNIMLNITDCDLTGNYKATVQYVE